jgi:discoidin domain receptor family protein 2
MPQGIQRGAEVDLSDRTYDGREESGYLSGGLGQLVDGQKGQDIFRLDLKGHGKGKYFFPWFERVLTMVYNTHNYWVFRLLHRPVF